MKRQVFSLISLLALLLVAGSAIAQTNGLQARVPFDFMAGNKTLAAGTYSIDALSARDNSLLVLRGADTSMILGSNMAQSHEPANKTKLVFNRYGDQYFLSEIWVEGATLGRQLPKTNREKEAAAALAEGPKTSHVEIVASLN